MFYEIKILLQSYISLKRNIPFGDTGGALAYLKFHYKISISQKKSIAFSNKKTSL